MCKSLYFGRLRKLIQIDEKLLNTKLTSWSMHLPLLSYNSSAENQKGVNDIQRCSVENQKGTFAIDFVQQ